MIRYIFIIYLFLLYPSSGSTQTSYITREGVISFYSSAPLEDIEAVNNRVQARLDAETGELLVRLRIEDFSFRVALMQKHFNERFMESHIYPEARFVGKIENFSGFSEGNESEFQVNGELTIHGVTRDAAIDVTLRRSGPHLIGVAKFPVSVADYDIAIPRMFIRNIAEVVDVSVEMRLAPVN